MPDRCGACPRRSGRRAVGLTASVAVGLLTAACLFTGSAGSGTQVPFVRHGLRVPSTAEAGPAGALVAPFELASAVDLSPRAATVAGVTLSAAGLPPVKGPAPSTKVAAFYYPWYGGINHWQTGDVGASLAADDIMSDYYPVLGPYDSQSARVVAQHMAWLRSAGVGVVVTSWWFQGSYEDKATPVIMAMAARYGVKVAFHLEPHPGRTADQLVKDVAYIYRRYGSSPAFFRTKATTPYNHRTTPQGVFFLWDPGVTDAGGQVVHADYWRPAVDAIHASAQGGLIVGATEDATWIDGAHFDGLYNYVTLKLDDGAFAWARSLPPGALYVPSVMPGNSAKRVGYPPETFVDRNGGATYDAQWKAALGTGIEPFLMTVTSFNEWHEGTQVEPAASGHIAKTGRHYSDFSPLPPTGYLSRTRVWVTRFAAMTWPRTYRTRISVHTTSGWTDVRVSGAVLARPQRVGVTGTADYATYDGARFSLGQPLDAARAGRAVSMTWDLRVSGVTADSSLTVEIERGNLGATTVTLYNYLADQPVAVESTTWDGLAGDAGRNPATVQWPASVIFTLAPPTADEDLTIACVHWGAVRPHDVVGPEATR